MKALEEEDMNAIFSNVEELCAANRSMLNEFETADDIYSSIGEVYLRHVRKYFILNLKY